MHLYYRITILYVLSLALPAGADLAVDAVRSSGVRGGLVVHVGATSPDEMAALRLNDRYMVQGLSATAQAVEKVRNTLHERGLYGPVSMEQFNGRSLPYIENFVNLLVVEENVEVAQTEALGNCGD